MKYNLSLSKRNTYIYIRVNEPVTEELLAAFISETSKTAKDNSINNFLFDLRLAPNCFNLL